MLIDGEHNLKLIDFGLCAKPKVRVSAALSLISYSVYVKIAGLTSGQCSALPWIRAVGEVVPLQIA